MKSFSMRINLQSFVEFKMAIKKAGFKIPDVLTANFKNINEPVNWNGRKSCPQSEVMCNISFDTKDEYVSLVTDLIKKYTN